MALTENVQSNEEKQAIQTKLDKLESGIAKDIIKTYDLPTSIADAVDDKVTSDKNDNQDTEETSSEENTQSTDTGDDNTSSEQTGEETEVKQPDSVQKRIDELTREKKQLEARLKKLESKSSPQEVDYDLEKLRKMSVDELQETRKKILRAQRTADETTLDSLFDLEEKVNKTIEDAPRRFQSQQIDRFNEAVADTSDLTEAELKVVYGHANNIFAKSPTLQRSLDGQAEAWKFATEHYREMNKLTVGKSKVNELERKVNDLKKKTSLDTAVQKGNSKISEETKLYNKAKGGSSADKEAFLKKRLNTDSLIPEEFRRL